MRGRNGVHLRWLGVTRTYSVRRQDVVRVDLHTLHPLFSVIDGSGVHILISDNPIPRKNTVYGTLPREAPGLRLELTRTNTFVRADDERLPDVNFFKKHFFGRQGGASNTTKNHGYQHHKKTNKIFHKDLSIYTSA